MEKLWLKNLDPSIPTEIDADSHPCVWDMVEEAIVKFGDKTAFSNFGAALSYQDMDRLSAQLVAYLQSELGLKKGDRIAIMCPNILAFPITLLANLRGGFVQVNVNPQYTARELVHQLNDADTDTIVIFSGSTSTLSEIVDQTKIKNIIVVNLGDFGNETISSPEIDSGIGQYILFKDAISKGAELQAQQVDIKGEDLLFLQYTGGTTGLSKGAALSQRNLVANINQFSAVMQTQLAEGEEVVITALPLYHIFALMVNCLSFFVKGGTNVLITNPGDMPGFVAELSRWPFTAITGVNTLFNGLLHTPGFSDLDFSTLKIAAGGGTAIQEAISNKWRATTGAHITEGYGLSETSPVLTFNQVDPDTFSSSIGIPMPSTDISLRNEEGTEVEIGEPGELCAKGPQVMSGYWRNKEETEKVTTADGYFMTGDVAILTKDGLFKIVDRMKDMIIVSGFNVYPNEIEAVIANMEGVLESACIGVPSEKTDEAVKLFVVKNEGAELTEEDIIEFCRKHLVRYKVPKQVEFIDAVPKSAVGKLLRRELRPKP